MKKIVILAFSLLFFSSLIFADYKSDLASANKEYKAGNYKEALVLYKKVYKEHPSKQVESYITFLENKLSSNSGEKKHHKKAVSDDDIDWADKDMFIAINPVGLIVLELPFHYEMCLNKGTGLGFDADPTFFSFAGWTTFGFQGGADYNFYFQEHAPNGWFAGPGAGLAYIGASYSDSFGDKASASTVGFYINGHGGYRWIWDNGFLVDVIGSLQYTALTLTLNIDEAGLGTIKETLPYGGVGFGIGADVGYAW